MGVTTWLDRITDESNLWLTAIRAEERGDYASAAVTYLKDAEDCLQDGSKTKAALDCYCAASCMELAGAADEAKKLYGEAGVMYSETADSVVSSSIREALWALQRAYECFVMAEDVPEANAAHEAFALLERRTNPFADKDSPTALKPVSRRAKGVVRQAPSVGIRDAAERFLSIRRKSGAAPDPIVKTVKLEEEGDDEEGIVSQLG